METAQPLNKEVILNYNQNTDDIIDAILDADKNNPPLTYENAIYFEGVDDYQTGANIFYYLKENIRYEAEPDTHQTTKTIERLVADKKGDCKHYSLFAGAVLKALNIPYAYRFVSFGDSEEVQHVYIVIHPDTNPIYLDAVIDQYDTQESFNFAEDYYPEGKKVNGIGQKFFTLNELDIQSTTAQEGIDYTLVQTQDYSNIAIINYTDFLYTDATEKKNAKHIVNKVILALGRAGLREMIMNVETMKPLKQILCSFYIMTELCYKNKSVFNSIIKDMNAENAPESALIGWAEFKAMWYNFGGKESADKNGLVKDLVDHSKNYILDGVSFVNVTPEMPLKFGNYTLSSYLTEKITGDDMPTNILDILNLTENDITGFLGGGTLPSNFGFSVMGRKKIGSDPLTASEIVVLIGSITAFIIALLEFIKAMKEIQTAKDIAAANEALANAIENAGNASDGTAADPEGEIPSWTSPLAIAAIFFGAVIFMEDKV